MQRLQDFLREKVKIFALIGHPLPIERFVVKWGQAYAPAPWKFAMGPPQECYTNASRAAIARIDEDFTYVEGFMWRKSLAIPVQHAWIEKDGKAFDVTIKDSEDCEYYGVSFPPTLVQQEASRNGYYGLLASQEMINLDFMTRFDPGFGTEVAKVVKEGGRREA